MRPWFAVLLLACGAAHAADQLSFVNEGVIPAPIIPQLCAAMGVRSLRRYGVTGEAFDAEEARRIGLIHEVCGDDGLDQAAAPVIVAILRTAPEAACASKKLVLAHAGLDLSDQQVEALAVQAAAKRASAEATEGLASFCEKRDPSWYQGSLYSGPGRP